MPFRGLSGIHQETCAEGCFKWQKIFTTVKDFIIPRAFRDQFGAISSYLWKINQIFMRFEQQNNNTIFANSS